MVATVLSSVLEKTVAGYFTKARRNLADIVEAAPGNAARLVAAYAALTVLAVIVAGGAVILPVGLIIVATALADSSVDKPLMAGILLSILGAVYLLVGTLIIRFGANTARSSLEKATKDLSRKLEPPRRGGSR
jgi:chromate transport protein ChrA